ncbi:MAG: IS110 family transposase [Actinomycetota bacterium]
MTIVADKFDYVIGVDTHARTHTYAIVAAPTGALIDMRAFPVTKAGMARALDWAHRHTSGQVLAAVECTGSYGATLTRVLEADQIQVAETQAPLRKDRRAGKSDPLDAQGAARSVLGVPTDRLPEPRAAGLRSALRVLLVARDALDTGCTADRNMLNALVRSIDLDIDARKALTDVQVRTIAAWRDRPTDPVHVAVARAEARRLATAVLTRGQELKANHEALSRHVNELAAGIQVIHGVGPVTAAIILAAYSHKGRIRSEAAFAALAGVSPIPASSGNTDRHRLNRGGDRQLNKALDTIARTRMSSDPDTKVYVARRTQEGKTKREIRRILKRYIARQIFRRLEVLPA